MNYNYKTKGTCSREINFSVSEEGKIESVQFVGGCHGNLQGIAKLVEGMEIGDVIERLEGIKCGYKNTSCPAQLAEALKTVK